MSEPVTISISLDVLRYIRKTLEYAADDLTVSIDSEYPADSRAKYPTYERLWKNDMEVVTDARYCMDQIDNVLKGSP